MAVHFASHLRRRPIANAEVTAVVGAAGIAAAFALSADHIKDGATICPFRLATGLPCPGCGLTRSWVYLAHGRWAESVTAHPFGVIAAALVVALIVTVIRARTRGVDPPALGVVVRRRWFLAIVGAWLTFAAGRLIVAMSA
jgi:hypothetical protein